MRYTTFLTPALVVLLALGGRTWAEDEPPATPAGTVFLDDLRKGLSESRRTKKPVFVWVSRREADENAERILRFVFQAPGSRAINEEAVAVRLRVGAPYDKKIRAFLRRHEIQHIPSFLILDSDGAFVAGEIEPTVGTILKVLAQAKDALSRWPAVEARWKKAKDVETRRRLSQAYVARREWKKARTVLRKVLAAEPGLEDRVRLLRVLRHTGTDKSRAKLLQALLDSYPEDERWVAWRIELAMVDIAVPLPVERAELLENLRIEKDLLRTLAAELTDPTRRVDVLFVLARAHEHLGEKDDLLAQGRIIRTKLEQLPKRLDLRRQLAEVFVAAEAYEEAKKELLSISDKNPDSKEAPEALYDLAHICYVQARAKKDILDSMPDVLKALEYLADLATRYPDSEAHRRADQKAMPAVQQLVREQMAAAEAEIEREEKKEAGK